MIDPTTGIDDGIVDTENNAGEQLTEEEQKAADEAKVAEEAKAAEAKKTDEQKEENRKAYELRQQNKNKVGQAKLKEEVKQELKAELKQEMQEKETARQVYPDITDDEFNEVKTFATASKISIKDALEKPFFKSYFKDIEIKGRVDGATRSPSNRVDGAKPMTEEDKIAERMSGNLPPGYKA